MTSKPPPRRLSEDALSDLLGNRSVGVLATVRSSGHPHLTTMIYHWDPGERTARFFTTADRVKVRQLRRDPRATLHVAGPDVWSFAVAEGRAELSAVSAEPGDAVGQEIWALLPADMRPADRAEFFAGLVDERRLVIRLKADRLYGAVLD